jgi:hypothetical protein
VARDLDNDPEQLSIQCLPLLRYSEAKNAFDNAKDEDDLKAWKGSSMMKSVKRNTFDLAKERRARWAAERKET